MTWSPEPSETRVITPKFEFFVTTGSFGENELVSYSTVTVNTADVSLGDFDASNNVTVTLGADGTLTTSSGAP